MLSKAPSAVTPEDLQRLVDHGVRETRTLEFKLDYGRPDGRTRRLNDAERKEFLADVSALANSGGGDLVIGVRDDAGEAAEVVGMDLEDPDAELNKLENILRDCLEPRLPSPTLGSVELQNGRQVLVIRVPRSWIGPHRVTMDNKFYARNSTGKYAMDVSELRQAFTLADTLLDRIRQFRHERLALIAANEAMVPLLDGPKVVMHIVPLSAFAAPTQIEFKENDVGLPPMRSGGGWNPRFAMEGLGSYSGAEHSKEGCHAYTLLFRTGIIEAVAHAGNATPEKEQHVYSTEIEGPLVDDAPRFMERLEREGIEGPFYLLFSLLGVRDHSLYYSQRMIAYAPKKVRQDKLLFPELILPSAKLEPATVRPLCDMVYNAFGFARSPSFGADGKLRRK